jgi:hypothetical protein
MRSGYLFLAALVVLAGCGASPGLPPAPPERFGAPPISSPHDVRTFAADPCTGLLGDSELAGLDLSAQGRPKVLVTGDRACDWRSADGARYLTVIVIPRRDVLVDTYRTRQFAVFRPTQVSDLPATREQSYPGSITCTVTVGTAGGQGFVTDYTGSGSDACDAAQRAAERVAAALPPLPVQ